jgi:hypothetical protein
MSTELRNTIAALIMVLLTVPFRATRVLVLPALFILMLVLLHWAAKPKPEE